VDALEAKVTLLTNKLDSLMNALNNGGSSSGGGTLPTICINKVGPSYFCAACDAFVNSDNYILARGVCWSTSPNPTIDDNKTNDGADLGNFSSEINGLLSNTTYYLRAYATNNEGTAYSEQKVFTTLYSSGPVGSSMGLFSVSSTKQVYFSQGDLFYNSSTFRFEERQCVGSQISLEAGINTYVWGSGDNPNSNTVNTINSIPQFKDWGINPISNGGNTANQWRTLTNVEYEYLINTRTTNSGIRFALATINGVNGIIILPDDWDSSYYTLNTVNTSGGADVYAENTITLTEWSIIEAHGAIFLSDGYWTSSTYKNWKNETHAYTFGAGSGGTGSTLLIGGGVIGSGRYKVRLVKDAE